MSCKVGQHKQTTGKIHPARHHNRSLCTPGEQPPGYRHMHLSAFTERAYITDITDNKYVTDIYMAPFCKVKLLQWGAARTQNMHSRPRKGPGGGSSPRGTLCGRCPGPDPDRSTSSDYAAWSAAASLTQMTAAAQSTVVSCSNSRSQSLRGSPDERYFYCVCACVRACVCFRVCGTWVISRWVAE